MNELENDLLARVVVFRRIDDAHAAFADLAIDHIAAGENLSGLKRGRRMGDAALAMNDGLQPAEGARGGGGALRGRRRSVLLRRGRAAVRAEGDVLRQILVA